MSLNTKIVGGDSKTSLLITKEGAVPVVVHSHPYLGESLTELPFRQFLTNDGTSLGSEDMRVLGSASSYQDFYIESNEDKDIYITSISFEISDLNAALNKFGNITALTNGCKLCWDTADLGSVILGESLTSNYEFVRLCQGNPAFTGSGTTAFRAANVFGNSEGYIPVFDIIKIFGMTHGLRLRKGKKDKLILRVNDDTRGVDSFNAIVYGKQI